MSKPTTEESQRRESIAVHRLRVSLVLAVVALTVPAAYLHGVVLHRWGDHRDLQAHVEAISRVPDQIGQWRYIADGKKISERLQQQLELRGSVHRVYEHSATGQRVSVLLLVGPSGPLVRHPPEICYQARANRLLLSRPIQVDTGDGTAQLRLLSYESNSSIEGDFYVAYAFGADGVWDNPASPRLAYAGRPVLYKLHALTDMVNESASPAPEGLSDFLSHLLPVLNEQLPSGRRPANDEI